VVLTIWLAEYTDQCPECGGNAFQGIFQTREAAEAWLVKQQEEFKWARPEITEMVLDGDQFRGRMYACKE
jgi:predicted  nucleic acid-binding Zn-ribbon protein